MHHHALSFGDIRRNLLTCGLTGRILVLETHLVFNIDESSEVLGFSDLELVLS